MNSKEFHLIIISSGPGELSNWVQPICEAANQHTQTISIEIMLTPCQFATGNEYEFAAQLPCVTKVFNPSDTFRFTASPPYRSKPKQNGAVLFLGGEPLYSYQVARKTGFPAFGYSETPFKNHFKTLFTRDNDGDLMASKLFYKLEKLEDQAPLSSPYTLFLAGSRKEHFKHILPLYTKSIALIKKQNPNFKAVLLKSPFLSSDIESTTLETQLSQFDAISDNTELAMKHAQSILTIPGTNTAEAAYIGTPMSVILPLNKPSVITLKGLAHYISKLPILGHLIRLAIIYIAIKKYPYLALPNILTKKEIVPEYKEKLTPERISEIIKHLNQDIKKQNKIKQNLSQFMPTPKTAEYILNTILKS